MGKVEKVIVLSVLFLVALILVVTVTVDDPLDKTNVVEAGGKKAAPLVARGPASPASNVAPLLNTSVAPLVQPTTQVPAGAQAGVQLPVPTPAVVPNAAPVQPTPTAAPVASVPTLPPGALLKQLDGLQDSWFPDLKLYTWKEGDTWRGIADTYYGDWQRLDVLKRHNEGRMDVQPGETVFVPVFAGERPTAAAEPAGAMVAKDAAPTNSVAKSGKKGASEPKTEAKASGKKMHVVTNGESLWKIAKAELGDGNRWKEIYEANRDLLDKPESIKKGMRLRIP